MQEAAYKEKYKKAKRAYYANPKDDALKKRATEAKKEWLRVRDGGGHEETAVSPKSSASLDTRNEAKARSSPKSSLRDGKKKTSLLSRISKSFSNRFRKLPSKSKRGKETNVATPHRNVSVSVSTPISPPPPPPLSSPRQHRDEPIATSLSRHILGPSSLASFLRALRAYRTPLDLPYAFLRRSEFRFCEHKKLFFDLRTRFKYVVRAATEESLADALNALMDKWERIFTTHRDEILREQRFERVGEASPMQRSSSKRHSAGDFSDFLKIVNAPSRVERKTPLHKCVERGELLRVLLLVSKCSGLLSLKIKDARGRTALDLAEEIAGTRAKEEESDAASIVAFVRACSQFRWNSSSVEDFDKLVYAASVDLFRRRDLCQQLRKSAKAGTYASFLDAARVVAKQLMGLCPFAHVVDFEAKKENARTALEKALERPITDMERLPIVLWLIRHGADPRRVHAKSLRDEVTRLYEEHGISGESTREARSTRSKGAVVAASTTAKVAEPANVGTEEVDEGALVDRVATSAHHWSDSFSTPEEDATPEEDEEVGDDVVVRNDADKDEEKGEEEEEEEGRGGVDDKESTASSAGPESTSYDERPPPRRPFPPRKGDSSVPPPPPTTTTKRSFEQSTRMEDSMCSCVLS